MDTEFIPIFINGQKYELTEATQTGAELKRRAGIALTDVLFLQQPHEDQVIANEFTVTLRPGAHLHSQPPADYGLGHEVIPIFINGQKYELTEATQTGAELKRRAGIALTDVLFLQQPHEDQVVANEATVTLRPGAHLHSQPPADYGLGPAIDAGTLGVTSGYDVMPQPDGWTFVVVHDYSLPQGYQPASVKLLVKLPPLFPEAQPDMFWVAPAVKTATGVMPAGVSTEQLLGSLWQRFSWHLKPGAWKPGVSTLRDFMRCIRARFERGN